MTDAGLSAAMVPGAPAAARKRAVLAGRLLLALLLVLVSIPATVLLMRQERVES